MKHTKGNWVAIKNESFWEVNSVESYEENKNIFSVNVLLYDSKVRHLHLSEENEANAKLIASAPELLEACILVLKETCHHDLEQHVYDKLNNAIKKATS